LTFDWLTVAAQVLNFLILVWLLQKFLYGPIMGAMEARELTLKQKAEAAAKREAVAQAEADRLRSEYEALEARREGLFNEARADTAAMREQLEDELRGEIAAKRKSWLREIEAEEEEFLLELRRKAVDHFCRLSREALGGLAQKTLNEAIAEGFVDQLEGLAADEAGKLKAAALRAQGRIVVESSFTLSSTVRRQITTVVHQRILSDAAVDYTPSKELVCGVRLRAGGQAVGWSLEGYLDRLQHEARLALDDVSGKSQW
jgi:F-type H+-transporting ATPase subunit b